MFGPGVSRQTVTVTILDSSVPKPDRQFEIILANPSEGLVLGSPNTGQWSILLVSTFLFYSLFCCLIASVCCLLYCCFRVL